MSKITAVIPAYNEADRITGVLERIRDFVDETIVVDDASTDNTAELASRSGSRVLFLSRNSGYIEAIKLGFSRASGDIVVTLDADGEFPPESIPDLVQPILQGRAEMVQAHRDYVPRPSERLLTWLAQKKAAVGDSGTGMRALPTELARKLQLKGVCICGVFSLEVLAMGGRIEEIPIQLANTAKPRRIAWFHLRQFFYLLPWMFGKPIGKR